MTPRQHIGGCQRVKLFPCRKGVGVMKELTEFIKAVALLIKAIASLINSSKKK